MEALNAPLRALLGGLLAPFAGMPTWVGLAVVSFLITLVAMPIIKWTLRPQWSDAVKPKMQAAIFELRLFNDSLRATFRALFDLVRHTLAYLGVWLIPLIVMSVPMLPVFSHLQTFFGYEGLRAGESTLVQARFAHDRDQRPNAQLSGPSEVSVETAPLWIPSRRELVWRVAAATPGVYDLNLTIDGQTTEKTLVVADSVARRSLERPSTGFWRQLLYPAEPPLAAASGLDSVTVNYPEAPVLLAPVWCWWVLAFTIVFAFALKKPFGVRW